MVTRSGIRRKPGLRLSERIQDLRSGFDRPFWVANLSELFERAAYYAQSAVLAIYLHESLRLSVRQTGNLMADFGGAVWFLPVLGGSLADRFGFRRSLSFAYFILTVGYFLMGSLGSLWMAPLRGRLPLYWLVLVVLMVPALGPSLVKPVVAGTTARASRESVRALGYSIYYTLVNIGGMLGPIVAYLIRRRLGTASVFRASAVFVLAMFFATLAFYREPAEGIAEAAPSVAGALLNMLKVLTRIRFVVFLLIFSGFWIVFWQQFITLPLYIRGYINPQANTDLLLLVDAATVIVFQIAVSYLTRKVSSLAAMAAGILVASFSWLIVSVRATTPAVIAALMVLALGEMLQSPRYYEYVSRLAPPGQQGTYMGYAFLPVAIGYYAGGRLGGSLLHYFGEELHRPQEVWWVFSGIGFASAALMVLYNALVKPAAPVKSAS